MSIQAIMGGTRLAYVVRQLEGKVQREVTTWTKDKGLVQKMVEQPAGFMVYFPRGHVLRFKSVDELKRYQLDQPPQIVNLGGLNDPNSPLGKMLMSQDEGARRGAFESLEQQVIALATAKTGSVLMPEQLEDRSSRRKAVAA